MFDTFRIGVSPFASIFVSDRPRRYGTSERGNGLWAASLKDRFPLAAHSEASRVRDDLTRKAASAFRPGGGTPGRDRHAAARSAAQQREDRGFIRAQGGLR